MVKAGQPLFFPYKAVDSRSSTPRPGAYSEQDENAQRYKKKRGLGVPNVRVANITRMEFRRFWVKRALSSSTKRFAQNVVYLNISTYIVARVPDPSQPQP